MTEPVEEAFRRAIEAAGSRPPDQIIADGKIHRYPTNGSASKKSGWYILFADDFPAGKFGDWRTGLERVGAQKRNTRLQRKSVRTIESE